MRTHGPRLRRRHRRVAPNRLSLDKNWDHGSSIEAEGSMAEDSKQRADFAGVGGDGYVDSGVVGEDVVECGF